MLSRFCNGFHKVYDYAMIVDAGICSFYVDKCVQWFSDGAAMSSRLAGVCNVCCDGFPELAVMCKTMFEPFALLFARAFEI
jgi:hypothetical protein